MKIKNLRDIYDENSKVVVTTLEEQSDVFFGKTIGWSDHTLNRNIIDNDPIFEVPDDWDGYVTGIEVDYDIVEYELKPIVMIDKDKVYIRLRNTTILVDENTLAIKTPKEVIIYEDK